MICPSLEDLVLLLDQRRSTGGGSPAPGEGGAPLQGGGPVGEHVAGGCAACDRRIVFLRGLMRDLALMPADDVSAATVAAARSLAGWNAAEAGPTASAGQGAAGPSGGLAGGLVDGLTAAWRELVATVLPPPEAVPAFRSSNPGRAPLLYRADGFELDLTLLESGALVGQVLPEDPQADGLGDGDVYLYGPDCAQATELLGTGEFRFASVSPDRYSLVIAAGGTRILVPSVELEPR